jgi:hypothetical protein
MLTPIGYQPHHLQFGFLVREGRWPREGEP